MLLDAIRELPVAAMEQTWIAASHFQTKILRRKTSAEEYRFYRAGLEWNLTDPIVIENRDDIKSESRWHDRLTPYHHQVTNLITFCRRLPVTLLADDVGLGKTISAGLIISELMSRSRLNSISLFVRNYWDHSGRRSLKRNSTSTLRSQPEKTCCRRSRRTAQS